MSRHSWSKFWWSDHERDPALKLCSLAAQGAWVRLLCHMHEGEPPGHLTVNGRPPTMRQIGVLIGAPEAEAAELLQELSDLGVVSATETGILFSRRMKRDAEYQERQSEYGKKGGNPKLVNGPLRGVDKVLESESESESDSFASQGDAARGSAKVRRASRLPVDWRPSEADAAYARERGLDVSRTAEDFRGYWLAKAGKDAVKLDWSLVWQGWCRRAADRLGTAPASNGGEPPPPPKFL